MPVERHAEIDVDAPISSVAQAARAVLGQSPQYRRTVEQATRFETNVRPHWWLLGTAMTIDLQPDGARTRVSVATRSQSFIVGDVFGYYRGYIHEFLGRLMVRLREQTPH